MAPWAPATTPYDDDGGAAKGGCWADDLEEFLGGGSDGIAAALRSADGITWDAAGATPWDAGSYGLLAAVRAAALGLYVGVGGTGTPGDPVIATAPDGTTAWSGIPNTFVGGGFAAAVTTRASDGAILAAGQDGGHAHTFAISDDDTATWVLSNPLGLYADLGQVAVRLSDELILVVGCGGLAPKAATSADGGTTWVPTADPGGLCGIGCAARASDDALVVCGVDSDGSHQFGFLSLSTDSGASWTYHNPITTAADETSAVDYVAVRPSDGALVILGFKFLNSDFVGTFDLLVGISDDDGATWTFSEPFGAGLSTGFDLTVRASDDALIVAGAGTDDNPHLSISTDGGTSWTLIDTPFMPRSVVVRDSDDLILIGGGDGEGQVAVSADGGTTWTDVTSIFTGAYAQVLAVAVRPADDLLIAVGYDGVGVKQVAVSSDSGSSWSAIDAGPFSTSPSGTGFCVACKQSTGALVVGLGQSINVIGTSPDGVTFTPRSSPFDGGQVTGIDYSPSEDRWVAAGVDYTFAPIVAYSDDDGATWTAVANPVDASYLLWTAPSWPRVYRDEDTNTWWLLGQTTGGMSLARSDDNGATWTEVSSPLDPVDGVGAAWGMVRAGTVLGLCGIDNTLEKQMCISTDDGATWEFDANPSPFDPSTAAYGFAYSPSIPLAVVFGNNSA